VAALAWAGWLWFRGGVDVEIAGFAITSHDPRRPFLLGLLCLAVHVWIDQRLYPGAAPTVLGRLWTASRPDRVRAFAVGRRAAAVLRPTPVAVLLALATLAVGLVCGSRSATGSDAYGYVSQADLWLDGSLRVPQPWVDDVPWPEADWTFTPLGYRPVGDRGERAIVPTYPPGLPLIMALAKAVGGGEAMFVVVPLAGALLVLATYGIGVRLGLPVVGVWAAALVAASPAVVFQLLQPMTDVPVAAAWAGAAWFAMGRRRWESGAAGTAAAIGVLIRPNLIFLAAVFGAWHLLDGLRVRTARETALRSVVFVLPLVASMACVAAINASLYGSPATSGYGSLDQFFSTSNVWPNVLRYASWFVETQSLVAVVGLAAVFAPIRRIWGTARATGFIAAGAVATAGLWAFYVAYLVFDTWTYLRFLLPSWPFVMLGTSAIAAALYRTRSPLYRLAAAGMIVLAFGVQIRTIAAADVLDLGRGEARYPVLARAVRQVTPRGSVILAMQHSGTLRYYAGRLTLRYDLLARDWLDETVRWLNARGIEVYVLLDDWERPIFEERFRDQASIAGLDERVRLVYEGSSQSLLFALSPAAPVIDPFRLGEPDGPEFFPPAEERNPRLVY
jgi:hypothetical protein